jgi:hypothetical protein
MASEWVTVEVSLDPILDPIRPAIDAIDSVLALLIAILNIVQTILNVIKIFLVGLLDPIRLIVELIIAEIRNIIRDLRNLGVYITGDWRLIKAEDGFSNVLGGYSAYERRMLSRLLDTTDPNRPDFSSSSAVIGVFFYVSSGDINELVAIIRAILKFFGRGDLMGRSNPYGTPTTPEMKYALASDTDLGAFRNEAKTAQKGIPDKVSVSWAMPTGTGGVAGGLTPAPKGFLIHVSTIPDGFQVLTLSPKVTESGKVTDLPRVQAAAVDPTTNGPLKLYGGVADIGVSTTPTDFSQVEYSGDSHAALLVLQKDSNTPLIPPSKMIKSGKPLIANTFFAKTGFLTRLAAGTGFTATFNRSDLPEHVSFIAGNDGFAVVEGQPEIPNTYYFRIRALTKDFVDTVVIDGTLDNPGNVYKSGTRLYQFSPGTLRQATNGVLLPESSGRFGASEGKPGFNSFTPASGAGVADFPSAVQASYIEAVQAAVALAILSRADLTESNYLPSAGIVSSPIGDFRYNQFASGQETGLEGAGRDILAWYGIKPVWFKGTRPNWFRRRMRNALLRVASDLQSKTAPPESVAQAVVTAAADLLNFAWGDIDPAYGYATILESVGIGAGGLQFQPEDQGVGANPFCRMQPKKVLISRYEADGGPVRGPSFVSKPGSSDGPAIEGKPGWTPGEGSADFSPIIYSDATNRVEYIRNAISKYDSALYGQAAVVLQLAAASVSRPTSDTQWIAVRLMPQALAPLDELLEKLDRFLQGILDGLEGIIDKIVAYIEAIQARIYQLQGLLNKIRALLRALDFIRIPSVSALVLVENGTDGLVVGLVTAESKPQDAASSYGAGVAVVAGGLPSVLLELLALVFAGGGDE